MLDTEYWKNAKGRIKFNKFGFKKLKGSRKIKKKEELEWLLLREHRKMN